MKDDGVLVESGVLKLGPLWAEFQRFLALRAQFIRAHRITEKFLAIVCIPLAVFAVWVGRKTAPAPSVVAPQVVISTVTVVETQIEYIERPVRVIHRPGYAMGLVVDTAYSPRIMWGSENVR